MKPTLFVIALSIVVLACNPRADKNDVAVNEVPQALDDQQTSSSLMPRKETRNPDLVESLYNEILDEDSTLKRLEDDIDMISSTFDDSTAPFLRFDVKNRSYYANAVTHASAISDSSLRVRLLQLIGSDTLRYVGQTAKQHQLLRTIDLRRTSLDDLHNFLKVSKTLPVLRKYQDENNPGDKPTQQYLRTLEQVLSRADSLSGK